MISESTQNKVSGYAYLLALFFAVTYALSVQSFRWAAFVLLAVTVVAAPKNRAEIRRVLAHPVSAAKAAPMYALMYALLLLSLIPGCKNLLWVGLAVLAVNMLAPRASWLRKLKGNSPEI